MNINRRRRQRCRMREWRKSFCASFSHGWRFLHRRRRRRRRQLDADVRRRWCCLGSVLVLVWRRGRCSSQRRRRQAKRPVWGDVDIGFHVKPVWRIDAVIVAPAEITRTPETSFRLQIASTFCLWSNRTRLVCWYLFPYNSALFGKAGLNLALATSRNGQKTLETCLKLPE